MVTLMLALVRSSSRTGLIGPGTAASMGEWAVNEGLASRVRGEPFTYEVSRRGERATALSAASVTGSHASSATSPLPVVVETEGPQLARQIN